MVPLRRAISLARGLPQASAGRGVARGDTVNFAKNDSNDSKISVSEELDSFPFGISKRSEEMTVDARAPMTANESLALG